MSARKNPKSQKASEKIKKTKNNKISNASKNVKITNKDKMLEKVEKYVDKNREKTSQEMIERKSKRPTKKYQEWDLDVLISRVSIESKPKENVKETSKIILYIIYAAIIAKFFFTWNIPQNW